jgi:hypothetical protein
MIPNLNFPTDYMQFDVDSLIEKYNKAIQKVQEQKFPIIQGNIQQLVKAYNYLNAYFECVSAFRDLKRALSASININNQVDIENIDKKYLVALSALIKLEEAISPKNQKVLLSENTVESIEGDQKPRKRPGPPVGWKRTKVEETT